MKVNAPEKLYIFNPGKREVWFSKTSDKQVEYTRTDAFIEKAWDWVENNILSSNQQDKSRSYFEQFKNHMKGE